MPPQRHEALDLVRMLAALAVFAYHATTPLGIDTGGLTPVVRSLDLGVLVFFSLSGYLVARPFFEGRVDRGEHYRRRLLRIVPAYLVAVVGTALLSDRGGPLLAGVAWTLFVEVVFYLLLPLLPPGVSDRRRLVAMVAVAGLSLAGRVAVLGDDARSWEAVGRLPFLWLWAFLPGVLVAYALAHRLPVARALEGRGAAALGLLVVAVALVAPGDAVGPIRLARCAAVAVGSALMIPGLLSVRLPRPVAPMAAAGRALSYPFYLWHATILLALVAAGVTGWAGLLLALALALLASAASWRLVERPAIALSRRPVASWPRPRRPQSMKVTETDWTGAA